MRSVPTTSSATAATAPAKPTVDRRGRHHEQCDVRAMARRWIKKQGGAGFQDAAGKFQLLGRCREQLPTPSAPS